MPDAIIPPHLYGNVLDELAAISKRPFLTRGKVGMDGVEIRALRKQMGLTQEEFAHQIGVTFATVNRWENGKSEPSRLAIRILAAIDAPEKKSSKPARKGR